MSLILQPVSGRSGSCVPTAACPGHDWQQKQHKAVGPAAQSSQDILLFSNSLFLSASLHYRCNSNLCNEGNISTKHKPLPFVTCLLGGLKDEIPAVKLQSVIHPFNWEEEVLANVYQLKMLPSPTHSGLWLWALILLSENFVFIGFEHCKRCNISRSCLQRAKTER